MLLKSHVFSLTMILVLSTSTPLLAQRGGRGGGAPSLPTQSPGPAGQFPGFPSNAGVGQPSNVGQPATFPAEAADPRALDAIANGGRPELTGEAPTIADQLNRNERLTSRLAEILGVTGPLTNEFDNFPNLGLFVATAQVSRNMEEGAFDRLKMNMFEGDGMSLGEAIQAETALSEAEATEAASEASEEAAEIIEETS